MTIDEAKEIVRAIERKKNDDEVAHSKEDSLRAGVLEEIAAGCSRETAIELAKIALSTDDIDFSRWCA